MTATFDREAVRDATGEDKRDCGECGLPWFESDMTPLVDRYGTWYRCPNCSERDAREYEAAS